MNIRRQSVPIPIGGQHGRTKDELSPQDTPQGVNSTFSGGSLSPHLSAPTPPNFLPSTLKGHVKKIGKYVILEQTDLHTFSALDSVSEQNFSVKIVPQSKYHETFTPNFHLGPQDHVNNVHEVLSAGDHAYVFFPSTYGDIHTYVRSKRKLREPRAAALFRQIVSAVGNCHRGGVVLRDLKLRKFVFGNPEQSYLVLNNLEDAYILPDPSDDTLRDKHGCPAYVSPEILTSAAPTGYSGKRADVWSLGVILYTMLIGRYPFHDTELPRLFAKIRAGSLTIPESVSPLARCLLHSILRVDPEERFTCEEILDHPWFQSAAEHDPRASRRSKGRDQLVPDVASFQDEDMFFFA